MARIKANNGHIIRGLIGPVVVRQTATATVISRRAEQKKSTTASSARNRLKMANVSITYSLLAHGLYAACFEGKKTPLERRGAFIGSNLSLTPAWLTKDEAYKGFCVLMPYQVSRGILPSITLTPHQGYCSTSILINPDMGEAPQTVGEFSSLVLDNNEEFDEGDNIAAEFLVMHEGLQRPVLYEFAVKLDRNSSVDITALLPSEYVRLSGMYLEILSNSTPMACTVVHARRGKTPRYSTQFLEVCNYDNSHWTSEEGFMVSAKSYGYKTQ